MMPRLDRTERGGVCGAPRSQALPSAGTTTHVLFGLGARAAALIATAHLLAGCVDVPQRTPLLADPPDAAIPDAGGPDATLDATTLPPDMAPVDAAPDVDDAVIPGDAGGPTPCVPACPTVGQRVFYAPFDRIDSVHVLPDRSILLGGQTVDLSPVRARHPSDVHPIEMAPLPANHGLASGYPVLLHATPGLDEVVAVHFLSEHRTGTLNRIVRDDSSLLDGTLLDGTLHIAARFGQGVVEEGVASPNAGYALLSLDRLPDALGALTATRATIIPAAGMYQMRPPFTVDEAGRLLAVTGAPGVRGHAEMIALDDLGEPTAKPGWRHHTTLAGERLYGPIVGGARADLLSALPLTAGAECTLTSWLGVDEGDADFRQDGFDGNGAPRVGLRPFDAFVATPCPLPEMPGVIDQPPGGHSWRIEPGRTLTVTAMLRDPVDGGTFIGLHGLAEYVGEAVPPGDGSPETVPVVMKLDAEGALVWWQRLHPDREPDGAGGWAPVASTAQQEIVGLAFGAGPDGQGQLVVTARTEFFTAAPMWANVTGADQTPFQGPPVNPNNVQVGWIGRLDRRSGDLTAVTHVYTSLTQYVPAWARPGRLACFLDSGTIQSPPQPTPLTPGLVAVGPEGRVAVVGQSYTVPTTPDALVPLDTPDAVPSGEIAWFVRIYDPRLETVLYSTALGVTDGDGPAVGQGLVITGIAFEPGGTVLVVGYQTDVPGALPIVEPPAWGAPGWPDEDRDSPTRSFVIRLALDPGCQGR